MEDKKLDVLGKCPDCGYDWNAGTIKDKIDNLRVFTHSDSDLSSNVANTAFGVNNLVSKSFSKVKVINLPYDNKVVYTCPNIVCCKTFDENGVEFDLREFKLTKYEKENITETNSKSIELLNYNQR